MNLEEAARNLATIRETQAKAMRFQPWLPVWFMAGIGLFVTGVQFITEPGIPKPVAVGLGIVLAAGMGALVAVFAKTRRMTLSGRMATSAMLPVYLPWLFVGIGLNLGVVFLLGGMDVPFGRTYAGLSLTAYFALGSPLISRWIARRMARKLEASL
ncbi:hypothetical protein [Sphaerimonospora mesophila]|uniref:hypothetical protein n=1 Tax=Sphaerimonospora mesophila TaxID=37483 RepID=UPI0006E36582